MQQLEKRLKSLETESAKMLYEILADHRHDINASDEPEHWSAFMRLTRMAGIDSKEIAVLSGAPLGMVENWYTGSAYKSHLYRERITASLFERFALEKGRA